MIEQLAAKREYKREQAEQACDWHKERISLAQYCFEHELIDSAEYAKRLRLADDYFCRRMESIYESA